MIDIDTYIKKIEDGLSVSPDLQQKVSKEIKNSVKNYIEEYPEAKIEDVYDNFGTPEKIVQDNICKLPLSKIKKSKSLVNLIIGVSAAVVILFVAFLTYKFIDNYHSHRGVIVVHDAEEITGEVSIPPDAV